MPRPLLIVLSIFFFVSASSQSDTLRASDSAKVTKKRIYSAARKATILSAILPGAGQVYNHKYWKVPVIYAGLGGFGYMFYINNSDYQYFSSNLAKANDKDTLGTLNETPYSSTQLVALKQDSKRLRDLALVGGVIVYLLNIVDANVDAHLATFDVSDDLSMKLTPWTIPNGSALAAGITIRFKYR